MNNPIINDQIKAFLESTSTVSPESWQEVQAATDKLADDPEYIADVLKTRFVSDILAAMRERNMSQSALARAIGKSRQYVSAILDEKASTNFTIETMTTLVKEAGTRTQTILSTQSATLLNHFTPEDVVVVDRKNGESLFRRLDSASLTEWLNDYTLGDLWQKNVLDGGPTHE